MLDQQRCAIAGLSLILKFGFDSIYSFGDIAIFIFCVLAGNFLFTPIFGEFWGYIFSKYGHPSF